MTNVAVDEETLKKIIPHECPICNWPGIQTIIGWTQVHERRTQFGQLEYFIVVATMCENCQELCTYELPILPDETIGSAYRIIPVSNKPVNFSENIKKISEQFINVYNQASKAEEMNLTEIDGMGYRKALEVLVVDYLLKEKEVDKKTAEKTPLSQLIDKIKNPRIKKTAKASAWIGNDESHYFRSNPQYNVNDMKNWIMAFVYYIEMNLSMDEASKLVDGNK
ncbi:hypothetical protein ABC657_08845 [Lentilactobacillus parabuchneri]|uniref:hypothetical protein n=1 Tax=Lentilactobacillus parabuchneri TaxID=152331 RepID=UPI0031D6ED81